MRKKTKDDENRHITQLFQERTIKRKNMGARHHSGQIMKNSTYPQELSYKILLKYKAKSNNLK